MKTSAFFTTGGSIYSVYVPEQDLSSATWLALQIGNRSLVYAEYGMGIVTLIDYTTLDSENIEYIVNGTQSEPKSYTYLRSFNVLGGIVAYELVYLNLTDLSPSLSQNCEIYSNGLSNVYFAP
jgi:uncharacterized membrane protein